jgi:hypothetical protein
MKQGTDEFDDAEIQRAIQASLQEDVDNGQKTPSTGNALTRYVWN